MVALLASATTFGQAVSPNGKEARAALGLVPRHATISVSNLSVEKNWYIAKLGFEELALPQPGGSNGRIQGTELETPGFQIHLIQFEGSKRAETPKPPFLAQGWVHIAFSVADITTSAQFLRAAGVQVEEIRGRSGATGTLVLHDPEGNEIELFSR